MSPHRIPNYLKDFFQNDSAGGILLVLMAAAAMILANSPLSGLYNGFLATPV